MEEVFSSSRSHSAKKTPSSSAARSPAVTTTPPHPAVDALPVRTVAVPTGVTGPPVGVVNGMSMVYNSVSPLHQQYQSVAVPLANQVNLPVLFSQFLYLSEGPTQFIISTVKIYLSVR